MIERIIPIFLALHFSIAPYAFYQFNEIITEQSIEAKEKIVITERDKAFDGESARIIWDYCSKYSPSEEMTAAVMGMIYRESTFKSNSVAGWHRGKYENPNYCEDFVEKIDKGLKDGSTKELFMQETKFKYGGFGLCQWSALTYLDKFYDFAVEWGTSIADTEMQCAFIFWDIENNRPEIKELLEEKTKPKDIALTLAIFYEGTRAYEVVQGYAEKIYNVWHEN